MPPNQQYTPPNPPPNSAYPMQPNSPVSGFNPTAYSQMPYQNPRKSALPKSVVIGLVVIALLAVGVIALLLLKKPIAQYTLADLTTNSDQAVVLSYPSTWKLDSSNEDAEDGSLVYSGSKNDSVQSLYLRTTQPYNESIPLTDISDTAKTQITKNIVDSTKSMMTQERGQCEGFKLLNEKQISKDNFFGVDIIFSCKKNAIGISITERDRYIYIGDGNLYQVSIVAESKIWESTESVFNEMINRVVPTLRPAVDISQ